MSDRRSRDYAAPWRVPVATEEIPDTGQGCDLAADEPARAAIAKVAGLRALPRFEAHFDVMRKGAGGLHVNGKISATVGQTCVVTLNDPEPLVGGVVDLGALATEFLILGLDPYPRKQGAVFEAPQEEKPESGPFAALSQLAKRPDDG